MRIIAGKFKNRLLSVPKGDATRPTSAQLREAVFNICQHFIDDSSFLDVFAGSGSMGIEALSRGAKEAVFVELDRGAVKCIEHNLKALDLKQQGFIWQGDALSVVKRMIKQQKSFDIIYIDPPYHLEVQGPDSKSLMSLELLKLIDQSSLLKPEGYLFMEEAKESDLSYHFTSLIQKNCRRLGRSFLYEFTRAMEEK